MEGLLDGLKVVDLSSVLAGPLTGSFLAECGATVLKVEGPNGDVTRTWRVANEPRNRTSAYHAAANIGKQWVTCNLKTPEGRKWLHEALFDADVLIQNMKWRDLAVMELLPHTLREQFPQLVHVRLIGSEFDPDRLAYDVVVQAESGFMSMNGHSDRPPARLPVALMDVLASHHMRAAVLGGLYRRAQTGTGNYAEISLLGAGLTALANQATNVLINGKVPQRQGSNHPNIAPYGDVLTCSDGEVVLAVGSDAQFENLCLTLRRPALSRDPRFETNTDRLENRTALMQILNEAAVSFDRSELLNELFNNNVPAGAIFSVKEALDQPEVRAAYVVEEDGLARMKTSAVALGGFDVAK